MKRACGSRFQQENRSHPSNIERVKQCWETEMGERRRWGSKGVLPAGSSQCWGRQGRKLGSRSSEEEMGTQTSEMGWRREYWLEPTTAGTSSASILPLVALLAGPSREPAGEEE